MEEDTAPDFSSIEVFTNTDNEPDHVRAMPRNDLNSGPSPLDDILSTLLKEDMVQFQTEAETLLTPLSEYVTEIERDMVLRGKKLRPLIMMLFGRIIAGEQPLPHKLYRGAASLEMLHAATLIHDDIVDEALLRRGLPSVSATRGTKLALLIGDLHFIQALRGFADAIDTNQDMMLVRLVLDSAFDVCRGELDELDRLLPTNAPERLARYYRTVDRKTGALFRLACQAGAELAGGRSRDARRAGLFGRSFGRAFQIMDDILDLLAEQDSEGKHALVDLEQGRMSLPLLYGMELLGDTHPITRALREGVTPPADEIPDILDDLRECGAMDRAYVQARREMLEALFYLQPFPENPYRTALERLTRFIVDRPLSQ